MHYGIFAQPQPEMGVEGADEGAHSLGGFTDSLRHRLRNTLAFGCSLPAIRAAGGIGTR